jgi:hypothetical protein
LTKLAFFCSATDLAGTAMQRTMKKLKNATKNMKLRFLVLKVSRQHGFLAAGEMKLDNPMSSHIFKCVGDA